MNDLFLGRVAACGIEAAVEALCEQNNMKSIKLGLLDGIFPRRIVVSGELPEAGIRNTSTEIGGILRKSFSDIHDDQA